MSMSVKAEVLYRLVAKVLVVLMVIQGWPLWELSQAYKWEPRDFKEFSFITDLFGIQEAYAAGPVADAGVDQSVSKNQPLGGSFALDGSGSYDPDGDPLIYQWYGPFATTFGPASLVPIPEGVYSISLTVDDGTSRSEIDTAVITVSPCFNIYSRAKSGKVQLTWANQDGTERYDVYRSDESDPFSFEKIGETTSTYSTYLDDTVLNETTYLYVVGAYSGSTWCYSDVICSHPTASRGRANYAPVIYSSPITHGTTGIIYNYDVNAADPNGDALSYSLSACPVNMDIDPDTGLITWIPGEIGSFDVTIDVTDSNGGADTQTFTITVEDITAPNRVPVADAGPDQTVLVDDTVTLDGSGSTDVDGDLLGFMWSFVSVPDGSTVSLADPSSVEPTFIVDVAGTYVVQLIVNDGVLDSDPDTVTISTENRKPVANAGPDQTVFVGDTATLDGSGSSDVDGDLLSFMWSFTSMPDGSMAVLSDHTAVNPTFDIDEPGIYVVQLITNDGILDSDLDAVNITAVPVNDPPTITSAPVTTGTEDQLYTYDVEAEDPDIGDVLAFSLDASPAGMTIDSSTGLIEWIPTSAQVGDNNISIRVEDSGGLFDTQGFTITVEEANHPPVITSDPITIFSPVEGTQSNFRPGELFIASSLTDEIRVYDAESLEFIQAFTHPLFDVPGSPPFSLGPNGAAFNNRGNLVVATYSHFVEFSDYGAEYARYPKFVSEANEVLIFDPLGNLYTTTATGGSNLLNQYSASDYSFQQSITLPPGAGQLTGMTFDDQRRIYIGSQADAKIHVFIADETFSTFTYVNSFDAPASGWMGVEGLQINQNGELVVACADMFRYNPNTGAILGTFDAPFDSLPVPVTIDNLGRIYVADFENGSGTVGADIIRFSSDGSSFIYVNDADLFGPFGLVISGTSLPGGPPPRYVYDVDATDPDDGNVLTFSLDVAPAGMEIDPITGLIVWTSKDMQVGDHSVTVRVEDRAGLFDNQSFTVTVADVNERPVANAGSDQSVSIGDTVTLDGSASSDVDGDPLTYQWSFTSIPSGSGATLSDPAAIDPTFEADLPGTYVVQLIVNDGTVDSDPDSVTITTENSQPVANAGSDQTVDEGDTVQLNGGLSSDSDGDPLTYFWSLTSVPSGSTATLSNSEIADPTFVADLAGTYVAQLIINDGTVDSDPDTVTITATEQMITVPDLVGMEQAAAEAAIIAANLSVGNITTQNSTNVPEEHVISQDPAAGSSVSTGTAVDLVVSLGEGQVDYVKPDLEVTFNHDPPMYNNDEQIVMIIDVSDDSGSVTVGAAMDGSPLTVTLPNTLIDAALLSLGSHEVVVTARDQSGNSVSETKCLVIRDPDDSGAPIAQITTPSNGDVLSDAVDVTGTASDSNLFKYELSYAPAGTNDFTVFHQGTASVTDGVLGTFDPAAVMNGMYTLKLIVIDGSDRVAQDTVNVCCEGEEEVGNFSLTFPDITVNIGNMPIVVNRIYDSRKRGIKGDFGYGWSVELVKGLKAEPNMLLGEEWTQTQSGGWIPSYCIAPASGSEHYVLVTYPGGKQERFNLQAQLTNGQTCQALYPINNSYGIVEVYFQQSTINSSLEIIGESSGLTLMNGQLYNGSLDEFNPTRFRLVTSEGWTYDIDTRDGLLSMTEPNGDTVTLGENGIIHSAGHSVTFNRDSSGKITSMTDPEGNVRTYEYDERGNLIGSIDAEGYETHYRYNSSHGLTKYIDALGRIARQNEYDETGRLVAMVDAEGRRFEIVFTPGTNQEILHDFEGNTVIIERDEHGNIITETDHEGNDTSYEYDSNNNMTRKEDPAGNVWQWEWDEKGNKLSETLPSGAKTTWEYDSMNHVIRTVDPDGHVTAYTYDSKGNRTGETDALGYSYTKSYDASGKLTSFIDKGGFTYSYEYDANGRKSRETRPDGSYVLWTYNNNGAVVSKRIYNSDDELIDEITNEYNARGNVIRKTTNGSVYLYEYDGNGNLIRETDPSGRVTQHLYDSNNILTGTVYPDGTRQETETDSNGRPTSYSNDAGLTVGLEYNQKGQVTRIAYADGSETVNTYDSAGNKIEVNDRGSITRYEYDVDGRVVKITGPEGGVTTFTCDAAGNHISETDPNGNITQFEYDALGRLTRTIFADGTDKRFEYNGLGWKTAETDQNGHRIVFTYDSMGNITSVTNPLGETTTYTYDAAGNRLTITDPMGRITTMAYDADNNLISGIFPDGNTETYEYNDAGYPVRYTDRSGGVTTKEYDSKNQLIRITYPNGTTATYSYVGKGRVADIHGSDGSSITYSYDVMGRITHVDHNDGRWTGYTYDPRGNRLSVSTPEGITHYIYDQANRLIQVTDNEGGITTYIYDTSGNLLSQETPDGLTTEYTYDSLNRLISMEIRDNMSSLVAGHYYTLATNGMRTVARDIINGEIDISHYTYDNADRIIEETKEDGSGIETYRASYVYDAAGNRTSKTVDGLTTSYIYNDLDQLITEDSPSETIMYTYNDLGQLVSKSYSSDSSTAQYEYNEIGKLARTVDKTGNIITYTYDLNGNISGKSLNGVAETYIVDAVGNLPQVLVEYDNTGTVMATYTFGHGLIKMRRGNLVDSFYHYDGMGNTRILTHSDGTVTDTYLYDAFGNMLHSTGATVNAHLFMGERYDANTGFYYMRARMYDSAIGRFTSMDPFQGVIHDPVSLHKYLYSRNNPINFSDPTGKFTLVEIQIGMTIQQILITINMTYLNVMISAIKVAECTLQPLYQERWLLLDHIASGFITRGIVDHYAAVMMGISAGYRAMAQSMAQEILKGAVKIFLPVSVKFKGAWSSYKVDIADIYNGCYSGTGGTRSKCLAAMMPTIKRLGKLETIAKDTAGFLASDAKNLCEAKWDLIASVTGFIGSLL